MARKNEWTIRPATGGMTLITVVAFDPHTGRPAVSLGNEFGQVQIRAMVLDLCQCANLPEPWKRG